jgi:hypothetical protein
MYVSAVLGINEDDDVTSSDGLREQCPEGNALAGLCGAHEQRAALEVLQRAVERALGWFDAVDVGKPNLSIGLRVLDEAEPAQQLGRQRVILVVDLLQFIEPLGMHRQPLETEPEEELVRIAREGLEPSGRDHLHGPSGQRSPHLKDLEALAEPVPRHEDREHGDAHCSARGHRTASGKVHDEHEARHPPQRGPHLVGGSPGHLVTADQHGLRS